MPANFPANNDQDEQSLSQRRPHLLGNSERIRQKFGSYGITILRSAPGLRISSLYSTHDGLDISRTLAFVFYPEVIEPAFRLEHEAILNGASIGIVFKDNGWQIDKHHQYFGEIETPSGHFQLSAGAQETTGAHSAIHVYSLVVRRDGCEFQYASIAEIHHPEFLRLKDLSDLYGKDFQSHLTRHGEIDDFLAAIESKIQTLVQG